MIFAEFIYPGDYWDFHKDLGDFLSLHFKHVESGLQSDSWYWILDGDRKVALDTFSSARHQIKSDIPGVHVQQVIEILKLKYELRIFNEPMPEAHE